MNDAKSMLMMYSYAAMKAAEEKAAEEKDTTKVKVTKRRGKKNDEGTERADSTVIKE